MLGILDDVVPDGRQGIIDDGSGDRAFLVRKVGSEEPTKFQKPDLDIHGLETSDAIEANVQPIRLDSFLYGAKSVLSRSLVWCFEMRS